MPSFLYHFDKIVPYDMPYCHYNFRLFLSPARPLSTRFLQDLVGKALLESVREPQGTLTGTQEGSLFATPTETYLDALWDALHDTQAYIMRTPREHESGGGQVAYDYRLDLRVVSSLLQATRLEQDVHLLTHVIRSCETVSLRLLRELCKTRYGVVFSDRRLTLSLNELERQGVLKRTKTLRVSGREVVRESNKKRFAWLRK